MGRKSHPFHCRHTAITICPVRLHTAVTACTPCDCRAVLQEYDRSLLKFSVFYLQYAFILLSLLAHCFAEKPHRPYQPTKVSCVCHVVPTLSLKWPLVAGADFIYQDFAPYKYCNYYYKWPLVAGADLSWTARKVRGKSPRPST